jgi:hypothetical protein
MRVFISHSKDERWLATRMRDELEHLGVGAFLYEKDVTTGEVVIEAIRANLAACDDFVILLSPTSVKSPWVLVELGGALILRKLIVTFHMYLRDDEIPAPIASVTRRHINDTEAYYDELRKRLEYAQFVQEKQEEAVPKDVAPRDAPTDELRLSDVQKLAEDPVGKADEMSDIVRRLLARRAPPVADTAGHPEPPPKPKRKRTPKAYRSVRKKKE